MDSLERGLWDIASFNLGLRPLMTGDSIERLSVSRFDRDHIDDAIGWPHKFIDLDNPQAERYYQRALWLRDNQPNEFPV